MDILDLPELVVVGQTINDDDRACILKADTYRPYLPEWLGIDEIWVAGENRCVLTDIGQRKTIDLLPDRKIETITEWLYSFRDSSSLQGVTMDMWRPFRKAVAAVFPNVPVVIDKFHVLKMANIALDKVRTTLAMRNKALLLKRRCTASPADAEKLDFRLAGEPELKAAYDLKEAFADLYKQGRAKDEVEIALDNWCDSVPKHMREHFKPLLSATKNWKPEILAYFDYRQTNAYTEAFIDVAKIKEKKGKRYGFDVLRARILFARPTPPVNSIE